MATAKKSRPAAGAGIFIYKNADLVKARWRRAIDSAKTNDAQLLIHMLREELFVPEIARSYLIDIIEKRVGLPRLRSGRKVNPAAKNILSAYRQMIAITKDKELRNRYPPAERYIFKNAESVKKWIEENFGIERTALQEIIYPRKRTVKKIGKLKGN